MFFNEAVAALRNAGCNVTCNSEPPVNLMAWHGTHRKSFNRCQRTGHFDEVRILTFVAHLRSLDKRDLGVA